LKRCYLHSQRCVLDGNRLMSAEEQADESKREQKEHWHLSDSFHPSRCQSMPHPRTDFGERQDSFEAIFTADKPVVFAFHGYPSLIYSLICNRKSAQKFHVFGYREEGDLTTPFDMRVKNGIDRFHLSLAALDQLTWMGDKRESMCNEIKARLGAHATYIIQTGEDLPEIRNWTWSG
jgi:phosphoketolase